MLSQHSETVIAASIETPRSTSFNRLGDSLQELATHRIRVSTIGDMLLEAADKHPDNAALIFPDCRLSYADLVARAYSRAHSLTAYGVGAGDAVGVLMPNCLEYMELLLGCHFIGALAVPMNARYRATELSYVVENADLKVLVTSDLVSEYADFALLLQAALPELAAADASQPLSLVAAPRLRHAVMLGASEPAGFVSRAQFEEGGAHVKREDIDNLRAQVRVEQPAIMMYTSGTTANPKGCPLSHALLTRNGANMNRERYFLTADDVFWAPLPMFHMAAILPFIACLDAGAALASMTHIDTGEALAMMAREKVSIAFPAFPTITNDLINHASFAATDLSRLRRINNVAPIETLRKFQSAFAPAIQTGAYGLTEAGGVIAFNHPDESLDERLTTCGVPFPGIEVQITDPDSFEPLATGQQGELWVRGYCVFDGYHKSPEKNAEAFHEGWFRTGDLCSVSVNNSISYHGRIKDMLKVGGENVAAIEIESFLAKHPAVALAQVIGKPDARLEEVPVAFIERVPGVEVSAEELLAHCQGEMASFKVPREVHFVTQWPMSSTKVQKFRLKDLLQTES